VKKHPITINILYLLLVYSSIIIACSKTTDNQNNARTYRLGFQVSAPKQDFNMAFQAMNMWIPISDAAIISAELPWDSLYAGVNEVQFVLHNYKTLVDYYRSKQLKLWIYMDPENGMNRYSNSDKLVAIGKSITQATVQQKYVRFLYVMDSILQPEHIGFAMETNLIRGLAPDSIYQGVRTVANSCATQIRALDKKVIMGISIQADYAWGKASNGAYIGIAKDLADFPFVQEIGISSYPYFFLNSPTELPDNYYSKIIEGTSLKAFVSEGGWSSRVVPNSMPTSLQIQSDYIARQNVLLNNAHATALFQLTFTDIDLSGLPVGTPANINQFAYIGLVDSLLSAKPALKSWSDLFGKNYVGE